MRLRRAPSGFCLSMITGFTLGTQPIFKYTTCWQQQSCQLLHGTVWRWTSPSLRSRNEPSITQCTNTPRMCDLICYILIVSVKSIAKGIAVTPWNISSLPANLWQFLEFNNSGFNPDRTISQNGIRVKIATERTLKIICHFKEDSTLLFILGHVKRLLWVWEILFLSTEVE